MTSGLLSERGRAGLPKTMQGEKKKKQPRTNYSARGEKKNETSELPTHAKTSKRKGETHRVFPMQRCSTVAGRGGGRRHRTGARRPYAWRGPEDREIRRKGRAWRAAVLVVKKAESKECAKAMRARSIGGGGTRLRKG